MQCRQHDKLILVHAGAEPGARWYGTCYLLSAVEERFGEADVCFTGRFGVL